ncbi:MAG: arabinose transporter permease [Rhizobacter sp.]|nr:arabinose transporter permease [Rhizobacter sp.]
MTTSTLWSPLRVPRFRGLWVSGAVYFLGNAMHTMACSWLMLEVTQSSFLAALVQTAVFLPMFLLSLPAGVLADIADRARIMQASLTVYTLTAAILAALSAVGMAGPATLLIFTFIMGCCTALQSPAWNSSVSECVPREELPHAITMVSMAFNGARAVGPALAGVVFAIAGSSAVFCIAVFTALTMMYTLRRHPPNPHAPGKLPPERLMGGMVSGLRFFRHSKTIFAQLVRTVAFSGAGSALWALLPVIAQQQGLGAEGFGLLMGCLGGGAVAVGFVIGKLRARLGLDWLVGGCCIVYGLVMLVAGLSPWRVPVYLALILGGASWMATMSTLNAATQTSAPLWVRARAAAMHTLCALGSFAIGSAVWGALSGIAGLPATLTTAGAFMIASALLARPFPLRMGLANEIAHALPWQDLSIADEPRAEAGPVAVEIAYRIEHDDADRFLDAAERLRQPRRRAGATFWRIYRDLGDPSRYVERFIVTSWADYLRQRERATVADQELEGRVRSFHTGGHAITMQHYIAER